jgi:hypothetical protein
MSEKKFLKKSEILAIPDIKKEEVFIPVWDSYVMVYGMTGSQRGEYEASAIEMRGKTQIVHLQNLKVKLCTMCIRDENGKRMFDDDEIEALGQKSAQAIEIIFTVAKRLSGIDDGDVEQLSKNFASEENAGSGSASL